MLCQRLSGQTVSHIPADSHPGLTEVTWTEGLSESANQNN